jgi:hypothetical protein
LAPPKLYAQTSIEHFINFNQYPPGARSVNDPVRLSFSRNAPLRRNQERYWLAGAKALHDAAEPFPMFEANVRGVDENQVRRLQNRFLDSFRDAASRKNLRPVAFKENAPSFQQALVVVNDQNANR